MHNHPPRQAAQTSLSGYTTIGKPTDTSSALPAAFTFASAFTTLEVTATQTITSGGSTFITAVVSRSLVSDPSQFSSITASEARASSASAAAATSATATAHSATSSAAAGGSNGGGSSVLIPAIVVPIVVVLLASFGGFWFFLHKRHKKRLAEEPEFIMAGKPEKPITRENSHSSRTSSTRELVPMSKLEKEATVTTTEVARPAASIKPSMAISNAARPVTPLNKQSEIKTGPPRAVPNFSSPRPGAHRNRPSAGSFRDSDGPYDASGRNTPVGRPLPSSSNPSSPARTDYLNPRNAPPRTGPSPLNTTMSPSKRAAPPKPISPPTPTGAFNHASPISQYSPIVKDPPISFAAIAASTAQNKKPGALPDIQTSSFQADHNSASQKHSPIDSAFTGENLRIAQLADSSRLGLMPTSPLPQSTPTNPYSSQSTTQQTHIAEPEISPQLPPPTFTSVVRPPTARTGNGSMYQNSVSSTQNLPGQNSSASHVARHVSVISRVSSNDDFEDDDIDSKSDVSSLDEREKWELAAERPDHGTPTLGMGLGGFVGDSASLTHAGPRSTGTQSELVSPVEPTGTVAETAKSLRDRDSEGPFMLNRY